MKLIIATLLSLNLYSLDLSSPQMLPRMLKYKQSVLNKYTCHSNLNDKDSYRSRESFSAQISCDISCSDGKKTSLNIAKEFVPRKLSLSPGDGSSSTTILWRSLAITLNVFKKQVCFEKAQSICSNSEISSFKANSIESGNWKLNQDITCKSKGVIHSPFDSKFLLNTKNTAPSAIPSQFPFGQVTQKESTNEIKEFLDTRLDALEMQNIQDCKKLLKIDSCFGDCVYENDKPNSDWIETISTPTPYGEDTQYICIDKFYEEIKHSSRSVSLFKCEKLIWEYIRTAKESGESCAAMRYNSNCADLF